MQIEADMATIYSLINDPKPDGITVESAGGATKAFNLNVNVNIDLSTITVHAAALWILGRAVVKGRVNLKINGQALPEDESSASKTIADAINADQQKDGNGN
jgi:hypothetical protein